MVKRWILVITAAVMVFSMVACKSAPKKTSGQTDIGSGVILYQTEAAFQKGTTVTAEVLNSGAAFDRAQAAVQAEAVQFAVFEINATKDGTAVQPTGDVTVVFPVPDGYSSNIALYYVSEDGTAEALTATVDSDKKTVTAKLSHFSTYVLVDLGTQSETPHSHSFGEWEKAADSHWKACSCGQKDSVGSHSFGEWVVTKETTETDDGSKMRTCAECGYEETRVIPNSAHIHAFSEWKYDSDSHWKECSCGQKENTASHSFGSWTVTKEATETAEGSRYRTCSECGYKETQVIPTTTHTHTFGGWESNADTHWKECGCGQKENTASHSFGSWTVTKEATTVAEGSRYRTCSVCGYKQTETIPVVSHTHTFSRTSAGLKKGTCDVCGAAVPVYNLGGEIYDRPGENLWLVMNADGSSDWYYEADSEVVVQDTYNAEFANNYSSYRYPVMEVNVFDGEANHRYVLIFYIEDGELKHIVPSDPNWDGVVPDNVVDPKEIFCSDGELREAYEDVAWSRYVITTGTTTLGGRTEEYTVAIAIHTPRSKSFWDINRMGPGFYTYYETSYSAPFQKIDANSDGFKNTVDYNVSGDYYAISAYTEKTYQAPDIYDLYYYQNAGLLSTLGSSYDPMYLLYSDMTCEKVYSTSTPPSKEIYQGLPYGLDFTLISDDPNEVVKYKFVVDHPEFRNITEAYKTVYTRHELYLVKNGTSGGYTLSNVRPS